jgi:RimJ/RimL family protein N-acetyltransferase
MLRGTTIGLRARRPEDVEALHTELYDDVSVRVRTDASPWRPTAVEHSTFAVTEPQDRIAIFSVVELVDDEPLAGSALLWGIDQHNQAAHLGLALRPAFRGRGLSTDIVRVLCYYGFAILHLHRLQIETLADNAAMIGAATAVGFVREGTLRECGWVEGRVHDEVIYGLLRDEWAASAPAETAD